MILLSMMILNLNRKQILWKYVCELLKILLSLTMTMKVFGIVVTFESKENVVKI